jgi:hypothetical protein
MSGENDRWIIKFALPLALFAVPSFLIVLRLWLGRKRYSAASNWSDLPRQISIFFLLSYMLWWCSIAVSWFHLDWIWITGFAVLWPVLGTLLSLLGCGLAFVARDEQKAKLFLANILFLALSLSSIIAPN